MRKAEVIKYLMGALCLVFSALLLNGTNKVDIPECSSPGVLSYVIVLWKMKSLDNNIPIQDGRLNDPTELPLQISNGRSCNAEINVNGQSVETISYTVMRPIAGGAPLVTID